MAEPVLRPILAFVALTVGCGVLIAGVSALTRERIDENRARRFHQTVTELAGSARAAADLTWDGDVARLCPGRVLLRGAADGYGGDIRWLAAADVSGAEPVLDGVRITAHQETPGIVDFIDQPREGWMAHLDGEGSSALRQTDAVSGATITSRALLRSLADGLERPALRNGDCQP